MYLHYSPPTSSLPSPLAFLTFYWIHDFFFNHCYIIEISPHRWPTESFKGCLYVHVYSTCIEDRPLKHNRELDYGENWFSYLSLQTLALCTASSRNGILWNLSQPCWPSYWCDHYTRFYATKFLKLQGCISSIMYKRYLASWSSGPYKLYLHSSIFSPEC